MTRFEAMPISNDFFNKKNITCCPSKSSWKLNYTILIDRQHSAYSTEHRTPKKNGCNRSQVNGDLSQMVCFHVIEARL